MAERKIIEFQKGHLTKKIQTEKKNAQKAIKAAGDDLENPPAGALIDKTARDEYKRILLNLKKLDFVGNLDLSSLISYANGYSMYIKALQPFKDKDFQMVITSPRGEQKPNPAYDVLEKAKRQMESAGKMCGISVSSRLQIATTKAKQEEEEIYREFGAI